MFRTLRVLLRNGLTRELVYPLDAWIDFFSASAWLALFAGVVFLITQHTPQLAGWSSAELLLLLGVWSLIDDLHWGFFGGGLTIFSDMVNYGDFDGLLVKPASTQLLASSQKVNVGRVLTIIADLGLIVLAIMLGGFVLDPGKIIIAAILVFCGFVLTYAIALAIQTLSFWWVKVDNLWALYEGTSWISKYPLDIFGPVVKAISLTVVPFGVAIAFPAQALAGKLAWPWVLYAIGITVVFFFLSRWFFNFALQRYTSASS